MLDPLTEIITLLQPRARHSKIVSGAGAWQVRRREGGHPFFCVVLEGACQVTLEGQPPLTLSDGDFVLIPAAYGFCVASLDPSPSAALESEPVMVNQALWLGAIDQPSNVRMLVGHCEFNSPNAQLLVSLLPQRIHVRGEKRLSTLLQLLIDESRTQRPGRDVILARLLEVLFIEALRSSNVGATGTQSSSGLVQGLADERLAVAIRCMHEHTQKAWTIAQLARLAALSRSAFFERFSRVVGMPPMEYLLTWRMTLARSLLLRRQDSIADIALRVGYGSASAFSAAFARHTGMAPMRYVRAQEASAPP
jgi:AraC-like DNA-binding protein